MRFIIAILFLFGFTPLQAAEDNQRATEAMRAGNYAIAYCIWQPQADDGDADAQYNIGWLYHNGYGLAVDDRQALHWWQQATAQGHIDARFALAALYTHGGRGVPSDIDKAIPLYIESLATGDEEVRLILRNLLLGNDKTSRVLAKHLTASDWLELGQVIPIKSKRANIRRDASRSSPVIQVLDQGTSILAVSRQGLWVRVVTIPAAVSGWVHSSLLAVSVP